MKHRNARKLALVTLGTALYFCSQLTIAETIVTK